MMKLKVKVDEKLCIGSGSCVVIASQYFDLNSEGKSEVKAGKQSKTKGSELLLDVKKGDKEKLLAAARACPTQAIQIVDENGKKIYP